MLNIDEIKPDIEKVIKAMECAVEFVNGFGDCAAHNADCPYASGLEDCHNKLLIDALTLLKEQEPVKPEDQRPEVYGNFGHRFICGNCRKNIWRKNNYCPNCGRPVKWDG